MYAYILLMIIITFGGGNISDEYFKGIDDALRSISNTPYIREIVQGDLRAGTTPGWFRIGMTGLIIGLILVIALNFSADLVNSPRLKAMANIEMKEFGFSFLILIGLLALMYIMDEIFINVTRSSSNPSLNQCNSSGCVYRYIGDLIKNNYNIFKGMVIESVKIASAKYKSGGERTGFKLDYPGIPSLGFTVVSGFTSYIAEEQYYLLGLYIMSISSGIYALTMGLINIVAPLFISIGVFLRPLPFFRKLGGTMLAIGVGFFIVLPSVIVLLYSFPPSLGLSYTVNECPELCKIDIVAYSGNQRLTYDAAFENLSKQGLSSVEISIFLDGLNTRERNGVVSCEYINRNLTNIPGITPIVLQKGRNIGIDMNTCPRICRKIPYPIDIPICYFASSACSKLYDETNGMCFLEMYDLNLLSIPVRLADGSNRILRDYIRDSNCTKLLPMRPTAEDYNIYCPLSCRGYYNRIVWGPFSEEEIQRILNSSNRDILEMIDSVNGNRMSERIAGFLKDNNNFEMIISDIINGSIEQVWNADILITCGGMYDLLGSNQPCYDPDNYNHPIKIIHSTIRTNPPDDNTLRNSINQQYQQYGSGYGDKALQIRNNNKPLQDNGLSSYKIFQDVYQGLSFQTTEQQIIQDFRNRYLRRVLDNKQTIDIPNDPNFQGWRVRFGNRWRTSCNGNDVFQVMQLVVNVYRDPSITSVRTDDIFKIASCSAIFANYINQFIQSLKNELNMPFDAYGVCNPEEEFKIDCGYSDLSCPSETKCMNVYKTKAQQSPHQIWNSIRSTYFSGYSLDPSVARQELSKIGLPIYPKEQDCSLSISIHPDLLRFPPSPDCSKCREMSFMSNNNYLFDYIGNAVIRIVTLPLIAIFITFVTIISISEYLGGEVFLPGLGKVR